MTGWAFFLVLTVLCYGLGQGLTKQSVAATSTAAFIWLFLGAKLVVNVGAFLALGGAPLWAPEATTFAAAALAINAFGGFTWTLYFKALEHGPVSLVGSITAASPAVTVLLALAFLGERLQVHQAYGVAMAIGSGMLASLQPGPTHDGAPRPRRWLAYALVTFVVWGTYSALVKVAFGMPGADAYTFLVWNALGMAVLMAPFAWLAGRDEPRHPARAWATGLLPAALWALGDVALFRAFETGPASLVTPLSALYPLITLAYAAPVMGERLSPAQWGAVALSLGGVMLVSIAA